VSCRKKLLNLALNGFEPCVTYTVNDLPYLRCGLVRHAIDLALSVGAEFFPRLFQICDLILGRELALNGPAKAIEVGTPFCLYSKPNFQDFVDLVATLRQVVDGNVYEVYQHTCIFCAKPCDRL
jgi:hypothetical protein